MAQLVGWNMKSGQQEFEAALLEETKDKKGK